MLGGIAAAGADRILFAQRDGDVLVLDVESREIVGYRTPHPFCPERIEVSACAAGPDGSIVLADSLHARVRVLDAAGNPRDPIGTAPVAGMRHPDEPGVLADPVALLCLPDELVVVGGGEDVEHAVQRFDWDGAPRGTLVHPTGGFFRAGGIARIGEEFWVCETDGATIRRFAADGAYVGDVKLHLELQRPFRIADDGYGSVLLLLAPETEEEQAVSGVARIAHDGAFDGWVVPGGEEAGHAYLPFDLTVLPDGRFVVADLPLGGPPDVRLQLFGADGRFLRTLVADSLELGAMKEAWFQKTLEATAETSAQLTGQAQVEHYHRGGASDAMERAALLYRAATALDPADPTPRAGLGALLQYAANRPLEAAAEYEEAIHAGAPAPDFRARIAECRHDLGDLEGAITLLRAVMDSEPQPEEASRLLDELGSWFLEQAGVDPEA
jgi:hypothetical protein